MNTKRPLPSQHPSEAVESERPTSRLRRWQSGLLVILRTRRILNEHPSLTPHLGRPILFNTLLSTFILLVWLYLWWQISSFATGQLTQFVQAWVWSWVLWCLNAVFVLIVGIVSGLLAILAWRLLHGFLLGPVYADLSLRVEQAIGVPTDSLRGSSWAQAIPDTLVQVGLLIALQIFAVMLNGIPIIGTLLATGINFAGTTSLLGLDILGLPLGARGTSRMNQLRYLQRHTPECSGVGTSILLFQGIPLLGGFFTTLVLVGATELFHEIDDPERSPTLTSIQQTEVP